MAARAPGTGSRSGHHAVRRPPAGRARWSSDRGAVTVEAALALSTLVVFLALALGALAAVTASIRCVDAARELARLAARGEPERGREVAAELAPDGALLDLQQDGDTVTSVVSAQLLHPLPLRIGGRAVAVAEPGTAAS
ncbi:TadE family type IV pilus minor pilin [Pseudonocardia sp.]|uniref:TadE family type IV pilus minor pilin n=1 Tax=Pseudonocardia sp. TaxID=60912 RepID=UPI002634F591|nr:TadE family type IV pilus minor pilin [Pseudonocardia sp.]MCW2716451.1 helicase/secretion neighborhood TadE-like protein [Pseudonocardia sp.]